MHYIMMVYGNTAEWEKLSKDEKNQIHLDCTAWHEDLIKRGISKTAMALQPPETGRTVRARSGRAFITDGPFAETKEVLGGFEIIECKDLDEALYIAQQFPALRVGSAMEVRPLMTEPCWEK